MLPTAIFDVVRTVFNRGKGKPFPKHPDADVQRTLLTAIYNDVNAQQAGHVERSRVMVDIRKDGTADVCFAPDHLMPNKSKSCPPGHVIEGLATGVYEQFLKPRGIAPDKVTFHDYIPAYHFKGPTFFDSEDQPALWRTAKLNWNGTQYDLEPRSGPMQMFDPSLSRKVPKAVLPLATMTTDRVVFLNEYTPYTPRQQAAGTYRTGIILKV